MTASLIATERESASRAAQAVKRALDVLLAALALLVLAPLLVAIAVAIRVDSRGAPIFRQTRVGRSGRTFRMWKFRTMVADAERLREALWAQSLDPHWLALEHDPRITRVGRLLRHVSLDELPQLVNVLRGDMSLVGPRPLIPDEHARVPGWAARRGEVRPGITGLWQVSGRTSLSFEEMLQLDCQYVTGWSLIADLSALARTIPAVVTARGAN
jgi:lipopolysaccharide/colanic/teichoic acid biosynthesis glycosyltransferase